MSYFGTVKPFSFRSFLSTSFSQPNLIAGLHFLKKQKTNKKPKKQITESKELRKMSQFFQFCCC